MNRKETAEELEIIINNKLSKPLKPNQLPDHENQLGYSCGAKLTIPFFSPPRLISNQIVLIKTLELPCRGVWLIKYKVNIVNPNISISDDTLVNTNITSQSLYLVEGNNYQGGEVISLYQKYKSETLNLGESYTVDYCEIYNASTNLIISLYYTFQFGGRLFFSNPPNDVINDYTIKATRIG